MHWWSFEGLGALTSQIWDSCLNLIYSTFLSKVDHSDLVFWGCAKPGPKVINFFSCSTQLSMKFFLLIYVEMSTIVGISTFIGRKNSILGLSEPKIKQIS